MKFYNIYIYISKWPDIRQLIYSSITSKHHSHFYFYVIELFAKFNLHDLKVKIQTVGWVKTPLMYSSPTSPIYSLLPLFLTFRKPFAHVQLWHTDSRTASLFSHIQAQAADAEMVLEGDAVHAVPGGWLSVPAVATVIKYSCLCWSFREKSTVEQDIKEREETIRQRTSEVQVWIILKLNWNECVVFVWLVMLTWHRHSDIYSHVYIDRI